MTSSHKNLQILICGSGNGAQCLSVLAGAKSNIDVRILSLTGARQWKDNLQESNMQLTIQNIDGSQTDVYAKPNIITDDPEVAMSDVDIVFMVVPAYFHAKYLISIMPYIQANMVLAGVPGHAGFEYQIREIFGGKAKQFRFISFESTPWVCRIIEFGRHCKIIGLKEHLAMSFVNNRGDQNSNKVINMMQTIFGMKPQIYLLNNPLELSLMSKSILHPPLLFGMWSEWDGKPLKNKPLFYQNVNEKQITMLSCLSNEIVETSKVLEKKKNIDMSNVLHVFEWLKSCFGPLIVDDSSLIMAMRTNNAWNGLCHPMKLTDKGYVPDFSHRYFTEDVPFGIVVIKGIAEIANVPTPILDKIILWTQEKLGKEYIIGSKLRGIDVSSTRSPQKYGMRTIDDLFNF